MTTCRCSTLRSSAGCRSGSCCRWTACRAAARVGTPLVEGAGGRAGGLPPRRLAARCVAERLTATARLQAAGAFGLCLGVIVGSAAQRSALQWDARSLRPPPCLLPDAGAGEEAQAVSMDMDTLVHDLKKERQSGLVSWDPGACWAPCRGGGLHAQQRLAGVAHTVPACMRSALSALRWMLWYAVPLPCQPQAALSHPCPAPVPPPPPPVAHCLGGAGPRP